MDNHRSAQDTAQQGTFRRLLALAELLLMTAAVAFDMLIPSLLIVLFGVAFVLIRKEKMPVACPPKSLGAARFVLLMLGWAMLWHDPIRREYAKNGQPILWPGEKLQAA